MLSVSSVLIANKLNIQANGVNFRNKSQHLNFVLQTINILNKNQNFKSVLRVTSRDLTNREQADILHKSILYYGMLKQAGYH